MATQALFIKDIDVRKQRDIFQSDFFKNQVINPVYSRLSQTFYMEYFNFTWEDSSIVLLEDEQPVGLIMIFIKNGEASYFGQPAMIFISNEHAINKTTCLELMFKRLLHKFNECNVQYALINNVECFEKNISNCQTLYNQLAIVDLTLPLEQIKRSVRKSYKSLINWGVKNIKTHVMDCKNSDPELFAQFMNMHRKVSGKETRSNKTWDIQYQMIEHGEAFALLGTYQDCLVAASLILHTNKEAYYGVGVYDRNLMAQNLPLAHGMLFRAIERSKEIGIEKFILGDISNFDSIKEANIAKFKSGFTKTFICQQHFRVKLKEHE